LDVAHRVSNDLVGDGNAIHRLSCAPLAIANASFQQNNNNDDKDDVVVIQLQNSTETTRLHVFATVLTPLLDVESRLLSMSTTSNTSRVASLRSPAPPS
jgi:hypothetical protein